MCFLNSGLIINNCAK